MAELQACILVVESDVLIRNLIGMSLNNEGHFMLAAANEAEALELVSTYNGDIHLLITKNVDMARHVAGLRPGIRVILLSACTSTELKAIVRVTHPVAFLDKRSLPLKLRNVIESTLTGGEGQDTFAEG